MSAVPIFCRKHYFALPTWYQEQQQRPKHQQQSRYTFYVVRLYWCRIRDKQDHFSTARGSEFVLLQAGSDLSTDQRSYPGLTSVINLTVTPDVTREGIFTPWKLLCLSHARTGTHSHAHTHIVVGRVS